MGVESFISANPLTALFTLCNMILDFLILKKFLFKPVKKMIDDRQREVDDIYAEAEKSRAEADTICQNYQQRLSAAEAESSELIRNATLTAQQRSEEIIRGAKTEASAIREKAAVDIALEKKKAINEIKDDISSMALDIAEIVVEKEINAKDQSALIEDFIRKIGDTQ